MTSPGATVPSPIPTKATSLPSGASITITGNDGYHFNFSATGIIIHKVIVKALQRRSHL